MLFYERGDRMNPLVGHEVVAHVDKVGVGGKGEGLKPPVEKPSKQEMPGTQKVNVDGVEGNRGRKIERPLHKQLSGDIDVQKKPQLDIPADIIHEDPATPDASIKKKGDLIIERPLHDLLPPQNRMERNPATTDKASELKIERPLHDELPEEIKREGTIKRDNQKIDVDINRRETTKPEMPKGTVIEEKSTNNSEQSVGREVEKDKAETKETYQSSYEERIQQTPKEGTERGEWDGERGESKFTPTDEHVKEILAKYGLDGINYKDGIPDFSECAEATVEIDDMTENRSKNFHKCDEKCAEQWNKEARDGRTDWTARDVEKWRKENGYTWHERNDMKTCDLVPKEVNDYFGHLGGVSECKKRDAGGNGGEFDE